MLRGSVLARLHVCMYPNIFVRAHRSSECQVFAPVSLLSLMRYAIVIEPCAKSGCGVLGTVFSRTIIMDLGFQDPCQERQVQVRVLGVTCSCCRVLLREHLADDPSFVLCPGQWTSCLDRLPLPAEQM